MTRTNCVGIWIKFPQFPAGIWFKNVIFLQEIKISSRILKFYGSFVQILLNFKFPYQVLLFRLEIQNILLENKIFQWEKYLPVGNEFFKGKYLTWRVQYLNHKGECKLFKANLNFSIRAALRVQKCNLGIGIIIRFILQTSNTIKMSIFPSSCVEIFFRSTPLLMFTFWWHFACNILLRFLIENCVGQKVSMRNKK